MGRRRYRQRESEDDGAIAVMLDVALRSTLGGGVTVVFLLIVGFIIVAAMPEPLRGLAQILSIVIFGFAGIVGLVTIAGMIKRAFAPPGVDVRAPQPAASQPGAPRPGGPAAASRQPSRNSADAAGAPRPRGRTASMRGDSLLTPGELAFYDPLREIVGERYTIQIKPSLADVLQRRGDPRWKTIASMHVDFLLCDARTLRPCLAIELDDRSHRRSSRSDTDRFKQELLAESGIPLLRQPCQQAYDVQELREVIDKAVPRPSGQHERR